MRKLQVRHYVNRATDYFEGMQLFRSDAKYKNSSALLAIHSAIAFSDALRTAYGNGKLSEDEHTKAADSLEGLLAPTMKPEKLAGIRDFRYLLKNKTLVTYGDKELREPALNNLYFHAERFAQWANELGSQREIEGWLNDE